jgi:hypothetical protein
MATLVVHEGEVRIGELLAKGGERTDDYTESVSFCGEAVRVAIRVVLVEAASKDAGGLEILEAGRQHCWRDALDRQAQFAEA